MQLAPHPVVDASRIVSGLYQGGRPPEGESLRRSGFDALVLAAKEHQPAATQFPGIKVLHAPLDDSGTPMSSHEWKLALAAARRVTEAIARGERVLVTCQQGRNRSGLISAITLHLLTGADGSVCAERVRSRRQRGLPQGIRALVNPYFNAALAGLQGRARRR